MTELSYEEMLERAYKQLPKETKTEGRFEIPKVKGSVQGNRTFISNLQQIANQLSRPIEHIFKFFQLELATAGEIKEGQAVFVGKFGSEFLNKKLDKYVKEFVLCEQCSKPDTVLIKEKGVTFKRCSACGARSSTRTLK